MIFSNLLNIKRDKNSNIYLDKCLDFISKHNLEDFSIGCHEIEDKDFFVNIVEYGLKDEKERFWEAHREYLDVHFIIRGQEKIQVSFIENCEIDSYNKEDDFVSFKNCNYVSTLILNEGDFLICYPYDVHMTALKINGDMNIKKAIFKIKI